MDSPTALLMTRWMVALAFREALASRLFWLLSIVTAGCIALCLSVRVQDLPPPSTVISDPRLPPAGKDSARKTKPRAVRIDLPCSEVTILAGAFRFQYRRSSEDAVRFIEYLLAGFVADTLGVLLVLLWTAGFLPDFLEPANAAVLLGKPVPRWSLLAGKYLGVVGFVGMQTVLFVGGTWLALGVSTGVWVPQYLLCVPVLLFHFAVFFSFSVCLAVWTRRPVVCMVGVLAFWAVCWGTNHSWHVFQGATPAAHVPVLLDAGYWVLPKPADLNWTLFDMLGAQSHFGKVLDYRAFAVPDATPLLLSALTSLLFAAGVLALSAFRFARLDY
jgi:ABC-type transport system involved in multi-copper enzyme maturation permease subunit